METLYTTLYTTYINELHRLNIGYAINESLIQYMFDLINAIDYIENGNLSPIEINKIITYYE